MMVGVDVSKYRFDVFELASREAHSFPNTLESIEQWLDCFQEPIQVAIEPTNSYHELVIEVAHARGHQVYVVDPHRLVRISPMPGQRFTVRQAGVSACRATRGQRSVTLMTGSFWPSNPSTFARE